MVAHVCKLNNTTAFKCPARHWLLPQCSGLEPPRQTHNPVCSEIRMAFQSLHKAVTIISYITTSPKRLSPACKRHLLSQATAKGAKEPSECLPTTETQRLKNALKRCERRQVHMSNSEPPLTLVELWACRETRSGSLAQFLQ